VNQLEVDEASRRWLAQCSGPDKHCRCWYDHENHEITDKIDSYLAGGQLSDNVLIRRLVLPLMARQRKVGTILLETAAAGPYMTTREVPIIIALAQQLAIAIENARLVLQLRERDTRRALVLQRTTYAQEAERKRIARELHDETGQALTALAAGLRGISKLMVKNPEAAISQIDQMQEISAHSLGELRHLINDLRPSHLDDLGLVAALHWQVDQVNKRGNTAVGLDLVGQPRDLPSETETTLFRIAQEGLVNVLKHANAKSARLLLSYEQDRVQLRVEDDGYGFNPAEILEPQKGRAWGLIGIQERAALLGGEVSIESTPGKGSTISVSVPYSLIDRQDQAVEKGLEN
jgi:signal transduction histidine kinase